MWLQHCNKVIQIHTYDNIPFFLVISYITLFDSNLRLQSDRNIHQNLSYSCKRKYVNPLGVPQFL